MLFLHIIFGGASYVVFYKLAALMFIIDRKIDKIRHSLPLIIAIPAIFASEAIPWLLGPAWVIFGMLWAESIGICLLGSEELDYASPLEQLGVVYLLGWSLGVIVLSAKGYTKARDELERLSAIDKDGGAGHDFFH